MKKFLVITFSALCALTIGLVKAPNISTYATIDEEYFTVYNADTSEVLFTKGDSVAVGDEYISADNKLYEISEIDEGARTGKAKYKENVKMPVYNIVKKNNMAEVNAATKKTIGLYHTHNDESYNDADGTDSIYGKGGVHDVGAKLKKDFEKLGFTVLYDESLHLPHNSGAYGRSEPTASGLLRAGADAIFDIHRDATPRTEYITTVDGVQMSKIRMVVGSANANFAVNKEFALNIKAYADEVYPNLIKDIYIGRGNYNQQLSSKAMLFEMGTNTIEKELVLRSTTLLTKVLDVVLYGANNASADSVAGIDVSASSGDTFLTGIVGTSNDTSAGLSTLWVLIGVLGATIVSFLLFYAFDKKSREAINRFFAELFGKKKHNVSAD